MPAASGDPINGPQLRDNRVLFDSVAELYDRARPTYPPAIFDDIVALSGIPDAGRILEIGPGTGQATLPMAERGYRITAVELGPNLAAVARRNLARYEVDVQVGSLEDWPLPDERFDLVMCFSAFHWLDHEVALPKIAATLHSGGALAYTTGGHVEGGTSQFFVDVQDCYVRHMPGTPPGLRLDPPEHIALESPITDASGLFEPAQHRRYVWLRNFTTQTYIDELNTYSAKLALSEEDRRALLSCIRTMIDERYGGRITKAYLTDLHVARRA
jgi:SAM-dependent methyltransferase